MSTTTNLRTTLTPFEAPGGFAMVTAPDGTHPTEPTLGEAYGMAYGTGTVQIMVETPDGGRVAVSFTATQALADAIGLAAAGATEWREREAAAARRG